MGTISKRKIRSTVYVIYTHNYNRIKLSTGIKIKARDWKDNELLRYTENYQDKKAVIDSYVKDLSNVVTNIKLSGKEPTVEAVRRYLEKRTQDAVERTLITDFDKYIESRKSVLALSSYKNFKYTRNMLVDFQEFYELTLDVQLIDRLMWLKIVNYMIQIRLLKDNTIAKHAALFNTFLRETYPDEDFSFVTYKYIQPTIITLREVELDKLKRLDLKGYRDKARDLFVFLCVTGMRYIDSQLISKNDIQEDYIEYFAQKTGNRAVTFMTNTALDIINKWDGLPPKLSSQKLNDYIKTVLRENGFDRQVSIKEHIAGKKRVIVYPLHEVVSSHVGRKTFITLALSHNINLKTVMDMVGTREFRSMRPYMELVRDHIKEARKQWDI